MKVRYTDIWRSEDGKVVENWVLIDLLGFMQQQIGIDVFAHVRDAIARGEVSLPSSDDATD